MQPLTLTGPDALRIERIKRALADGGIDALVARIPENILYVSGYIPSMGGNAPCAIFTQGGDVAVMASYEDQIFLDDGWPTEVRHFPAFGMDDDPPKRLRGFIRDMGARYGFASGKVAYEGNFTSLSTPLFCGLIGVPSATGFAADLQAALPGATLVDGTEMLRTLRAQKTPYELERMRRAAYLAGAGNLACKEKLHVGQTEAEIAATIETAITLAGSKLPGAKRWRGFAFVATGARTAIAWSVMQFNLDRPVERGDLVLIELHTMADGYWSDYTRTYAVERATERQREIWGVIAAAQRAAMAADRPGATGQGVDAAARQVIVEAGYGPYFPHHTGHGTGLCSHEPPFIHPNVPGVVLPERATHSCEPGIYHADWGIGIRIEDIVETAPGGARFLFEHDQTLD